VSAAAAVLGTDQVLDQMELVMGSEDFMIHSPTYDFDDKLLPIGMSYWINLVEQALPLSAP
jgi:metal-dependent amidase/aminoacylase/carboxypeptidase family protein